MRAFSILSGKTVFVLAGDTTLAVSIYLACLFLFAPDALGAFLTDSSAWLRLALAVLSVLGGLYFNELYSRIRVSSRVALILQLSHGFGLSLVIQTLLAYVDPQLALPRRVVFVATLLSLPVFFLWRVVYSGFLWKLFGQQMLLLVGSGSLAQDLSRTILSKPERGMRLAGYVGEPVSPDLLPAPYLGPFEQLSSLAWELKPERVVVACPDRREGGMPIEELLVLRGRGVAIEEGAQLYEHLCTRICSAEFRPDQYIFDQTLIHRPGSLALQSIYINLMALCGIVVLLPVLLAVAFLVKISTRESVLDSVVCTGYRGIPFTLKRFRTTRLASGSQVVSVTALGRILRKTHLDLLPALVNLLRGEMALVGPQPNRQEIADELSSRIPFYEQRYALRPGLTGWSQINMDEAGAPGDALTSLEYDLYYLKNMSLSLDAYVLLHRLRQMLSFA